MVQGMGDIHMAYIITFRYNLFVYISTNSCYNIQVWGALGRRDPGALARGHREQFESLIGQ